MASLANGHGRTDTENSIDDVVSTSGNDLTLPLGDKISIIDKYVVLTAHNDVTFERFDNDDHNGSSCISNNTSTRMIVPFDLTEEADDVSAAFRRKQVLYMSIKVGCILYLCGNIILSLSKPYERRMEVRSIPFSERRINIDLKTPLDLLESGKRYIQRILQDDEDEDEYYEKDGKENDDVDNNNADNNNAGDNNADDDNQAVDDIYYVKQTESPTELPTVLPTVSPTKLPTESPTEAPVIDDFFRYIDDDIERRTILPIEISDIAGLLCTSFSIFLSIGGGIGPGAILVGVYIIVMGFPPKVAIPLSCITSLGISTVSTLNNAQKKHPLTDRPIIDWDLILIMQPLTLFGAIAGTYLNKILAEKVIVTLLVLLLSIIAHNTLVRARKMHHAEQMYIKRLQWAISKKKINNNVSSVYPSNSFGEGLAEADPPFLPKVHSINSPPSSPTKDSANHKSSLKDSRTSSAAANKNNGDTPSDAGKSSTVNSSFTSFIVIQPDKAESVKSSLIEEEADPLPQNKITYIVAMFLFVIAMNVFKGGGAFESPLGIGCGSLSFWTVELLTAMWLIGCTFLASRFLLRRHAIKEAVGFDYVRGDIRWDLRTTVIYPSVCIIAGLGSGMFGIGCAVVIGPMLVGIGVNTSVAAATCGCLNFFTSLAATSSFIVLGSVIPDSQYAIACFIIGVVSSYVGGYILSHTITTTYIKKHKRLERHSFMAYSMGLVVLLSALSMTVEALLSVVFHRFDAGEKDGICEIETMY